MGSERPSKWGRNDVDMTSSDDLRTPLRKVPGDEVEAEQISG